MVDVGGTHRSREHRSLLGRSHGVAEQLDRAGQVRAVVLHRGQPEALTAGAHDVEPAVVVGVGAAQHGGAADLVQRPHAVGAHLPAGPDGHDPEPALVLWQGEQVAHQDAVALLEHVQRQHQPRDEHEPQGEQRQPLGHAPEATQASAAGADGRLERTRRRFGRTG